MSEGTPTNHRREMSRMDKPKNYYSNAYQEAHQRQIKLKINKDTEPEMLSWVLSQENIQGYLKELIKQDMERRDIRNRERQVKDPDE